MMNTRIPLILSMMMMMLDMEIADEGSGSYADEAVARVT